MQRRLTVIVTRTRPLIFPKNWAAGPRGIPDVPHAVTVLTAKCTEGSGVGFKKEPPVLCDDNIVKNNVPTEVHDLVSGGEELDLSFVCNVAKGVDVGWKATVLADKRLLLHVSPGALPQGSKECFVRILEYAEEEMGCTEILTEFEKDRKDRPLLMRTFMYFGFTMLPPDKTNTLLGPGRIAMIYTID